MSNIGNVYVFNGTPNAMLLILNNAVLTSSLSGTAQSSNYVPNVVQVARNSATTNPGNATFGGENTLIVSFPSGTSQTYPVNIDPNQIQIANDLQLYSFFNEVVLVTPTGQANQNGQSTVMTGSEISQDEVDSMIPS